MDNIPVHLHRQQAFEGHCSLQEVLTGLFEMRQPVWVQVIIDMIYAY